MKKTGILSLVLMAVIVFAGASSYAAPSINEGGIPDVTKVGEMEVQKEKVRERMTVLIETFAPDLLPAYQGAWGEHDALHVQLEALKVERKIEIQTEVAAVRAKVTSGELTFAEAKAELLALRETHKAEHDAVRAEIDALKATYGQDQEVVKAAKDALKAAVEANDAPEVARLLNELLVMLQKHIAFDGMKLDVLN